MRLLLIPVVLSLAGCPGIKVKDDWKEFYAAERVNCLDAGAEEVLDVRWAAQRGEVRGLAHCLALVEVREDYQFRRPKKPFTMSGIVYYDRAKCSKYICEQGMIVQPVHIRVKRVE